MRLIDLSHVIANGSVTYPGLPAPAISDHLTREASRSRYAPGTTFQIGRIDMVANTGTYIDAPSHRWENGLDIAALPLDRVAALDAIVIDGTELRGATFRGRAVLFRTGWSQHFGTPAYGNGHPFLTKETAQALIDGGALLAGIDSLNIDDTRDGERPVHTLLLQSGIPIVEHLTALDQLPSDGFRFFAVPARFAGMGSFPVRAFAML